MLREELAQHGYSTVRPVSESARFASSIVRRGCRESFAKVALGDHARELENEVWYALTLNRAAESTSDLCVRAPRIEAFGSGWFVCESLAASPLVAREDARAVDAVAEHAVALARILADLDRAFADTPIVQPAVEESDSAPVTDFLRRIDRWAAKPLEAGLLTEARVAAAKARITAGTSSLRPRLQHGDFVPWHVFRTEPGSFVLVDGEHASVLKPRFYDLAYLYARLWTRVHAPEVARSIVREFLRVSGIGQAEFVPPFLTILTQRAVGMHIDALNDHPANDYVAEAQELLGHCIDQDASALI